MFVCLWYQGKVPMKWVEKHLFLIFLEEFMYRCYYLFLQCIVEFPKKDISQIKEVSVLIVGRFLNTNYISLIDRRLFRLPTSLCGDILVYFFQSSVQSLSHDRLFATPWTTARQGSLSITNSRSSLKPMSIESMMSSNHLTLCHPLLLLPSIFPSIRVFSKETALSMRWPNYWSFSFNISPSNKHPGLIAFRMDCLDLLAVQGTLKSLLQHHDSKASILWHSAFFIVQLSHP